MTRAIHKLSDIAVKSAKKAGRHSDGGGLYLRVSPTGSKTWGFMWNRDKQRREIGLGSYPAVPLAAARNVAARYREIVAEGGDPKAERDREAEPPFAEVVEKYLATMEGQWSNAKHRNQWRQTLTDYCMAIGSKPVSQIGLAEVLQVLQPVWTEKPETASRLRGRIERVLNYAKAKGWRYGENPALWRGNLENVLPKPRKLTRGHHPAMSYQDVPDFVERLSGHEALAARALELLILTVCRSGEVLGARWQEIDLQACVWTVPAHRMKARREHRVPLTGAAMAILEPLQEARVSEFVFPGQKPDRPLSNMALAMLLRRMKIENATPHGFRSAFRDWAGDETTFPREVAEGCLAHIIGNSTERAYRRGDALEKRRALLEAWQDYCCAAPSQENVVRLSYRRILAPEVE
jgi:integrase